MDCLNSHFLQNIDRNTQSASMNLVIFSSRPSVHSFPPSLPPFQFNPTPNKTSTLILPPSPPISIHSFFSPSLPKPISTRAAWQPPQYVYPDPIPEFAIAETEKFRGELRKKLLKNKETFGDDMDKVVEVCAEIFREFLHKQYGGPGTLLVEPFTDMLLALKEKKLPGAPVAARAALLWAQNYVDRDWENWTSQPST